MTITQVPFRNEDLSLAMRLSLRLMSDPSRVLRGHLERVLKAQPGLFDEIEEDTRVQGKVHGEGKAYRGPDRGTRKPHSDPVSIVECIRSFKGWEITASEVVDLAKQHFGCDLRQYSVSSVLSTMCSNGEIKKVYSGTKGEHRYRV